MFITRKSCTAAFKYIFSVCLLLVFFSTLHAFPFGKKDSDTATYATAEELSRQNHAETTDSKNTVDPDKKTSSQSGSSVKTEAENVSQNKIIILDDIQSLEVPLCPATRALIADGSAPKQSDGTPSFQTNEHDHEVHQYSGFELCYREKYEDAEWVAYKLVRDELNTVIGRTDDFRADTKISTGSATPQDYTRSGYDRGHLAPAADMEWSEKSAHDSFLMSNMTPQAPQFNRGMWKDLEAQVRSWADRFGEVYVVTGPILEKESEKYKSIGADKVAVPEFFYKVLLTQLDDEAHTVLAAAFILPNTKCEGSIYDYVVSIDEVELRTGIDFFYLLPDDIENRIEQNADVSAWK